MAVPPPTPPVLAEDCRERFARGPLGSWHRHGDEPMLMAEQWEFRADGTGEMVETGLMGYLEFRILFRWESTGDRTIQLRAVAKQDYIAAPGGSGGFWADDDSGQADEPWEHVIRYDFRLETSGFPATVLHKVGESGFPCFSPDTSPGVWDGPGEEDAA